MDNQATGQPVFKVEQSPLTSTDNNFPPLLQKTPIEPILPSVCSPAKETPSPLGPYVNFLKPLTINAPKTQTKQSIEPIPFKS